ncbi:UBN1 [Cordylochernes scorpioides]|uniref:UBN1 n=1 Tax=Cordylochernes scorpioides TaxID=51811 RepID=A0ABY6LDI5_9ARAC|nr:UBN1 [Cordylochernes scorpioides]
MVAFAKVGHELLPPVKFHNALKFYNQVSALIYATMRKERESWLVRPSLVNHIVLPFINGRFRELRVTAPSPQGSLFCPIQKNIKPSGFAEFYTRSAFLVVLKLSFSTLVYSSQSPKKEGQSPAEHDLFDDDSLDNDKADIEALARSLEKKYGPKKRRRLEDFIDRGSGYDETDPFIDNDEAYDELVPSTLTTKHGGFYINCGDLDFKVLSDSDGSEPPRAFRKKKRKLRSSSSENGPEMAKKKRRVHKDIAESNIEVKAEVKPATPPPPLPAPDVVKKQRGGRRTTFSKLSSALPPNKKKPASPTVAQMIQQLREKSPPKRDLSPPKLEKTVEQVVENGATPQEDQDMEQVSPEPVVEPPSLVVPTPAAVEQPIPAAPSAPKTSTISDEDEDTPGSGTLVIDEGPLASEPPKLPDGLEADLLELINSLKEAATNNNEGKCKFFSTDINKKLLQIDNMRGYIEEIKIRIALGRDAMMELDKIMKDKGISLKTKKIIVEALVFPVVTYGCESWTFRKEERKRIILRVLWTDKRVEVLTKALSCTHRSVVFTHLAAFLPCTKETLLKRAKKLRLDQEDGRVRLPLAKLKDAVNAAMPKMLEKHDAVSKKNSKQPSTEGPRENGDVAKTGEEEEEEGLSPRFEWTAETRDLLCQVVDAKIRCFELFKTRTQSPEDYLKQFLETEVKPIWPLRWMQTRRIPLNQVKNLAKEKKTKDIGPTIRLELKLFESNDQKCPEFSYIELTQKYKVGHELLPPVKFHNALKFYNQVSALIYATIRKERESWLVRPSLVNHIVLPFINGRFRELRVTAPSPQGSLFCPIQKNIKPSGFAEFYTRSAFLVVLKLSFSILVYSSQSPKKEGQSPAEHDLFDDDSLDNDKADIEALARSLEKKYGPKKRRRLEDFIDRGSGYDETDPFIDNDEAYDELVPSTLTTKHGGFYINCGDLDFKVLSDSDGSEPPRAFRKKKRKLRSSSSENGPEMAKKKRRVHKDIAESNIEVKAEFEAVPNMEADAFAADSNMSTDTAPPYPGVGPLLRSINRAMVIMVGRSRRLLLLALPPTKKKPASPTVAQMIQQLREKSPPKRDLSPPKLEKTVEQVVENGATPQEDQDMEQVSPEPVVEPPSLVVPTPAAVEQPIPAAPSAPKTSTISDEDEDTPGSGTLVIDEGPLASEPPKLPDGLEADLLELINSLKEAATNNNEGKCKFFSTDINKKLLQVEVLTKALSCTHRSVVFTHLAAFLPCTKETLLKRAKKLRLDQEDGRVRLPLAKLKDAVNAAMPKMLEKHDAVSKKNSKQPSTEGPRENGDVAKTGEEEEEEGLSPRFEWTAETRDLLCQVVDAKIRCFELFKTRTQSPEDYLKQFLETEVKPIWPLRWMQTRTKPKKSLPAGSIASRKVKQEPSGGSPLPLDLDHIEIIPIPPLESEPVDIKPPRSMAAASSEPKAKPLPPLPDAKPIKIPNDTKSSKFLNTPETKSNKTNTTTICEVKSNKALTICETKPKHQSEAAAVKFRPEPKLKVASLPSGTEVRPVKPAMSLIQDMKMKQAAESKAAESSRNWVTKTGSPPKTTVSSTPTSLLNKTTPSHSEVLFTKLTTMPSSDMRQKSVLDGAKAHSSPRSSPDSSSANKRLLNNLMNSADLQVHATGSSSLLDQIICASLANYPNSNSSPEIPKPELQILEVGTGKPVQHRNLGLKETKPLPPASSLTKASSKPTTTYSTPSEGVKLPHLPYGFNEAFKKSLQNSGPSSIETKVVSSYVSRDAVSSTDYVGDEYSKIRKAQKYAASAKKPTFPEGMKGFPLPIKGEGSPFSPTAAPHLHKSPSPSSPGGSYQYSPDTRQIASAFVIKTWSTTQWQADLAPKEMATSDMRNRRYVQLLLTWSTNATHPQPLVGDKATIPETEKRPPGDHDFWLMALVSPGQTLFHEITMDPMKSSQSAKEGSASPWRVSVSSPGYSAPSPVYSNHPHIVTAHRTAPPMDPTPTHYTTSSHKPPDFTSHKLTDYPQTSSHKPPDFSSPPHKLSEYPQTSSHKPLEFSQSPLKLPDYPQTASHKPPDYTHSYPQTSSHKPPDYLHNPQTTSHYMQQQQQHKGYPSKQDSIIHMRKQQDSSALFQQLSKQQDMYQTGGAELYNQRKAYPHLHKVPPDPQMYRQQQQQQQQDYLSSSSRPPYHSTWPTPPYTNCATDSYNTSSQTGETKPKKSLPAGSIASRKVKQEPSGGSPLPLDLDHIEIIPIPPLESEPVDIKPPRSMAAASSEPKAKPLPPLPDAKPIKIPNDTKSSKFLNTPETKSNKTNTTTICEVKSNKALTICETKPKHQSEAAAVKFRPEPKLKVASLPSGTEVRPVKPAMSLIQDMKMKQAAESKAAESSRNWVTKTGSPPKTTVSSTPTSLLNKTTPSHSEVLFTKLTTMSSSDMRQKSVLDGAKAHSSPRSSPDSSSANKRLLNNLMNSADLQVHATGSSSLLDQIICASLANYPNSNSSPEIPKPELQILEVGTGKPVQHRNLGLKETKPLPPASSLTKASSKPTTTYSTPSEGVKLPHLPYGFNEAFKKSLQNSGPSSIETKVVSSYVSRDAVSSTDYVGDEYSKIRKAQKYAAASAKKPTFPEGMKGFPLPIKGEGSPFSPTAAPHLHKSPSPSSPGGSYQYSPDTRQNASAFVIKTVNTTQWQADLAPKEMAASDMRNRRHVQRLLTWSTNATHPVSLD